MNQPEPIDIDKLPPLVLEHETVEIEGGRNLYRYFVPGSASSEDSNQTESKSQTVSLESPEPQQP